MFPQAVCKLLIVKRKWWNWQTHHLEGVAPKGGGVQIPPSAPVSLLSMCYTMVLPGVLPEGGTIEPPSNPHQKSPHCHRQALLPGFPIRKWPRQARCRVGRWQGRAPHRRRVLLGLARGHETYSVVGW